MRSNLFVVMIVFASSLAVAHEGGHGTPEDLTGNLPKIQTKNGSFAVDATLTGESLKVAVLDASTGKPTNAEGAGLSKQLKGNVKAKGKTKTTPVSLIWSDQETAYQGKLAPGLKEPRVEIALNQTGKDLSKTVTVEPEIKAAEAKKEKHSHEQGGKPHSHDGGQAHSH
jgi:hypothetical protein